MAFLYGGQLFHVKKKESLDVRIKEGRSLKKKSSKRILSLALSFILLLSLCPTSAFATDAAEGQGSGQNVMQTASGNSGGGV